MPPISTPKLPSWADPQMASVTDPWYVSLARKGASLIGADDPASQAMGMGEAMHIPEGALGKELLRRAMLPAERTAAAKRAVEQGFTHDVFHGTRAQDFREFDPQRMDLGIHVTKRPQTASSAIAVTDKAGNLVNPTDFPVSIGESRLRTMPLKARMNKTLEMPDMGSWVDAGHWRHNLELPGYMNEAGRGVFDEGIKTNNPQLLKELYQTAAEINRRELQPTLKFPSEANQWPEAFKAIMKKHGYDSIAYPNKTEGVGELSYMLLHPSQVRSRFARFLPENINRGDLLGSLAGTAVAGGAIGGGTDASNR